MAEGEKDINLIYPAMMSLDGYIAHEFDCAEPDKEVHASVDDLGRRSAPTFTAVACTK